MKQKKQIPTPVFTAIASLAILITSSSNAAASGREFWLNVVNKDEVAIQVTINNINCYEPEEAGKSGTKFSLLPHQTYAWHINRVQGNGCDGKNGKFKLTFAPAPDTATQSQLQHTVASFTFDNGMNMEVDSKISNQYAGKLIKTASDKYQYQTSGELKKPVVDKAVGKAQAYWDLVCNKACTISNTVTVTNGSTHETIKSAEETNSVSKSLTIGVEFPYGVSAEASISSDDSKTQGQSFSSAISSERSSEDTKGQEYTPEDFNRYGIESIWRWIAKVKMQSGKNIIVATNKYTCTPNGDRPKYLPGAPQDIGSCNTEVEKELSALELAELKMAQLKIAEMEKKLGISATTPSTPINIAVAPATPEATTVPSMPQRVASQGASVEVNSFTLINDSATPIKVRWVNGSGQDHGTASDTAWTAAGQPWIVANGAKTWESHWFGVHTQSGFLCSISLRQGITVKLSQLSACKI